MIEEIAIEQLMPRPVIDLADAQTLRFYEGKRVLVTGGGGSIGSEIARQIARCRPEQLIIFDIYENNAYMLWQELQQRYGDDLKVTVEIGSVRDAERLDALFAAWRPQVVFHAAAHKHVPLMEHNPAEAVKNNCFGTYYTANMAEKYGAEKFVLVSTDKAVNPTSTMGASKRFCEMLIQCRGDSQTEFAAVRFGNVLGSNGSVIQLFQRQLAAGGPLTLTDRRMERFFMTIPEASQLVMQAGAMAKKGELFVLDMGSPVKIYDLAVNLIRLSGMEPGRDVQIEEVGLRPGEKLYEELLMQTETLDKTENDLIMIERDRPCSRSEMEAKVQRLMQAVQQKDNIKKVLAEVVPTYTMQE